MSARVTDNGLTTREIAHAIRLGILAARYDAGKQDWRAGASNSAAGTGHYQGHHSLDAAGNRNADLFERAYTRELPRAMSRRVITRNLLRRLLFSR